MLSFEVKDMTCGHCVSTITQAVSSVDPGAKVHIDLATHRVDVEPAAATADQLAGAIRSAGFSPIASASAPTPARPGSRTAPCCGCR